MMTATLKLKTTKEQRQYRAGRHDGIIQSGSRNASTCRDFATLFTDGHICVPFIGLDRFM